MALSPEQHPYAYGGSYAGAFNRPLAAGATLDAASSAVRAQLASDIAGTRPGCNSDAAPVWVAAPTDPVWTVVASGEGGTTTVRAPAGVAAGTSSDAPLEMFDNVSSPGAYKQVRCWEVSSINPGTKTINCINLGVNNYGPGSDGYPFSQGTGTGNGLAIAAGLIRYADIAGGLCAHALRVAAPEISSTFRAPAASSDQSGSGPLQMGMRLRLRQSVDPNTRTAVNPDGATGLVAANRLTFVRAICRALRDYGMVISDGSGGAEEWVLQMEGEATAPWTSLLGVNPVGYPYWGWLLRDTNCATDGFSRAATDGIPWDQFEVVADGLDFAVAAPSLDLRWARPTMTDEVGGPAAVIDVPYQGGGGTGPYWFWSQNYGGGCPAWTLALRNDRDWIVRLPGTPGHPDQAHTRREEALNIQGGRNVLVVGGAVTVGPGSLPGQAGEPQRRCIGIQDYGSLPSTPDGWGSLPVPGRIVHLEGVELTNDGGGSADGITVNAPTADVRVQNSRIVRIHSTQGFYTTLSDPVTLPVLSPVDVAVADGSGLAAGPNVVTTGDGIDLSYSSRSGNTLTLDGNYGGSGTLAAGTSVSQCRAPNGENATHADYIQPYGGSTALRVYRVTCSGNMQGLQVRSDVRPVGPAEFHSVDLSPFFDTDWNPADPKYQIVMGPDDVNVLDAVYLNPWPGESSIQARIAPDGIGTNNDWPDFAGTAPGPGDPGYGYVSSVDGSGNVTFPGTHAGGPDNPNITGTVLLGRPPDGDFMPDGYAGAAYVPPPPGVPTGTAPVGVARPSDARRRRRRRCGQRS